MFRSFLSWRYLLARRTNWIGVSGIFVGVAALILILSIMTGFLEESRKAVRGSLSDVLIEPVHTSWDGRKLQPGPEALLRHLRADPLVAGATAQLQWAGLLDLGAADAEVSARILSSSSFKDTLFVELIGVDIRSAERIFQPLLRVALLPFGPVLPPWRIQDEFDSTKLLAALQRGGDAQDRELSADGELPWRFERAPPEVALFPFLPPPGYLPEGRPKASVLVGEQLYRNLGMQRGDVIQIWTGLRDPGSEEPTLNNRAFVVAGTFRSGENEADLNRVYFERAELADFLGDTLLYSQILVRLKNYERDGVRVRDELRVDLAEAGLLQGGEHALGEVRTWEEFRGNLLGAIENERTLMAIMLSLVLVVAGFTIFAILSMMVTEKRRDIGILSALGATPRGILDVFLLIALWDALIGAILGAVAGTWAAFKIDAIERWLSGTFGIQIFNRDVYLFDHIPAIVQPVSVAAIVLGAFVCSLLFAALPAWRASRLDPLDALRYE